MDIFANLLFNLLYAYVGYRICKHCVGELREYRRREQRRSELIPGRIVDFELSSRSRPRRSGRFLVFYPIFEYQWQGKRYRKRARYVLAKYGRDLKPIPSTPMSIGDAVTVRLFPKKPSDARIEQTAYFWRSRTWANIPGSILGGAMALLGICSAVSALLRFTA